MELQDWQPPLGGPCFLGATWGTVEDRQLCNGSVTCSLPVGSKGSSASLMTRLLWLSPRPLSLGCRVQLNAPLVLGSLDCWSKVGGGQEDTPVSVKSLRHPPNSQAFSVHFRTHALSI